jgi:hypothetical protein
MQLPAGHSSSKHRFLAVQMLGSDVQPSGVACNQMFHPRFIYIYDYLYITYIYIHTYGTFYLLFLGVEHRKRSFFLIDNKQTSLKTKKHGFFPNPNFQILYKLE